MTLTIERNQVYKDFLQSKHHKILDCGRTITQSDVHPKLFAWQKNIVMWATRKGRCAVFLDTGLGKTFIQLEWARLTGEKTLIVAPLSVARQTVRESKKIDCDIEYVRQQSEVTDKQIHITNYEMLSQFDMSKFGAVVLDESSILKSIAGKTRQLLTEKCQDVPYRLCCTATPAPNDYIELGNHTEFLGICDMNEMLAMFFVNANKEHTLSFEGQTYRKKGSNKNGTEWRLKHHAEAPFFKWLSSWAITMSMPSDLGYPDDGFTLPPLNVIPVYVTGEYKPTDQLFFTHLHGISNRVEVRRDTMQDKLEKLKEILPLQSGQWLIWCGLDLESHAVAKGLDGAVEVQGSDSIEKKVKAIEDFQDGTIKVMVTKPKIAGFGMNFQQSHNMAFFGLNDSWETYYQCIRRQWRYGQKEPVNVYVILHEAEQEIYQNVLRKDAMARRLRTALISHIRDYEKEELSSRKSSIEMDYSPCQIMILPKWLTCI